MRRFAILLYLLPSLLGAQTVTKLAAGSVTSPAAGDTIVQAAIGGPMKVTVTCLFTAGKPTANDVSNLLVATVPGPNVGPILMPAESQVALTYVLDRVAGISTLAVVAVHAGTSGVTYSCELNSIPVP